MSLGSCHTLPNMGCETNGTGHSKDIQVEEMIERKKRELLLELNKIEGSDTIILWNKPKTQISKSTRGSKFRGVSRNGRKWQVQLLGDLRKRYIGSIGNEKTAAKLYDYYAILNSGLLAKTNFSYTKQDLLKMIEKYAASDILSPSYLMLKNDDDGF